MQTQTQITNSNLSAQNFSNLDTTSSSIQIVGVPTYREYLCEDSDPARLSASSFYSQLSQYDGGKLFDRFCKCRSIAAFARDTSTGLVKVLSSSCHLRFCPHCNRSRGTMIYKNTTEWLKTAKYSKFCTFTLKHTEDTLKKQIERLYKCFKDLRRSKWFSEKAHSGIWFFQVKKSDNDNKWHPHLHCIIDGKYIPLRKLREKWHQITTDSNVVDVRMIKDPKKAANYVARYAVKPTDITYLSFDEQLDIHNAIANRRLCGTWGKCLKLRLTSPPKFEKKNYDILGGWQEILLQVNTNPQAKAIYNAWLFNQPIHEKIVLYVQDDFEKPPNENFNTSEEKIEKFLF